jgi:hypothetical protein
MIVGTAVVGTLAFLLTLGVLLGPGPVLVVGGLFGLLAIHYVVWGWWLGGHLRRHQRDDGDQSDSF